MENVAGMESSEKWMELDKYVQDTRRKLTRFSERFLCPTITATFSVLNVKHERILEIYLVKCRQIKLPSGMTDNDWGRWRSTVKQIPELNQHYEYVTPRSRAAPPSYPIYLNSHSNYRVNELVQFAKLGRNLFAHCVESHAFIEENLECSFPKFCVMAYHLLALAPFG
ncbi:hypothetical protein RIF29_28243 [Crotalaria pallida]|uniref:Uncharacterized protein n=1 Tax=Crotalaria pallida TaxID=3830 RepID=A0AAN9ERQ0_CROPI